MAERTFTAVVHKEEDLFVAECPEVGTVSQGYTLEEAVANLKEATELYLEEFPLPTGCGAIMTTFEATYGWTDVQALDRSGFVQIRQRGSHVVMKKMPEAKIGCVVPMHRELAVGTLRGILKQAGLSAQYFLDSLWNRLLSSFPHPHIRFLRIEFHHVYRIDKLLIRSIEIKPLQGLFLVHVPHDGIRYMGHPKGLVVPVKTILCCLPSLSSHGRKELV
jgi:predicted RNA binding protein YcfA (HicA-like mRNA interferase family)/predicted RNase H-like HicB family nuclease